ncbi:MAG TPA: T9SS type A sorting domain-containing protein [Saprospiraceae bacterium]|nr:T9SS type A sorting domain-containing protein [Saprospiraceae bacterium]
MKINIHYVKGTYGNFYPGPLPSSDPKNGNLYANLFLNEFNNKMANLVASPTSLANKLGDSKIRSQLYTEASNPADLYGGIWYWDQLPSTLPYGDKVFHIIMYNGYPGYSLNGYVNGTTGCNNIATLYGAYYNVSQVPNNGFGWWAFAGLYAHELFHTFGLCHSFSPENECKGIDIDVNAECGCGGIPTSPCGSAASVGCCTWNSGSKNMMGYNAEANALTPCQWKLAFENVYSRNCAHFQYAPCTNNPSPIEITGYELWDKFKMINQPVRIMPGAHLEITCEVRFASQAYLEVRRGARLTVNGGYLTELCPNEFWPGIQVWGNPGAAQPQQNSIPTTGQAGIVRVINGSTISRARTGISTASWALGGAGAWANAGGLIYAENSYFINNRRAVEFMKYDLQNNSTFINNLFSEPAANIDGTLGVTIWACNGIRFERNRFDKLDRSGIMGIDFSASIFNHNQFQNIPLGTGIESYNTDYAAFELEIGRLNTTPNYFKNNSRHVYCSSNSTLDKVVVKNNQFFDAQTGDGQGVVIEGRTLYEISYNVFDKIKNKSCLSAITQDDKNFINCNSFSRTPTGIEFAGNNEQTQFLNNCFAADVSTAVNFQRYNGIAIIRSEQGNPSYPAGNCFKSPMDIIGSAARVMEFEYFKTLGNVQTRCDPNDLICHDPVGSRADGGLNNYEETTTSIYPTGCAANLPPIPPPFITPCVVSLVPNLPSSNGLDGIRQIEGNLLTQVNSNPADNYIRNCYHEVKDYRMQILRDGIRQQITDGNIDGAIALLNPDFDATERRILYSLLLKKGDYSAASAQLSAMPNLTPDLLQYKQIQQINLARLVQGSNFELAASQESYLLYAAETELPSRTYARGLLALLNGMSFSVIIPESDPINTPENRSRVNSHDGDFNVFPNPAQSEISISRNQNLLENYQIEISELNGKRRLTSKSMNQKEFKVDTRNLENGLYLLTIKDSSGKSIHTQKIAILK